MPKYRTIVVYDYNIDLWLFGNCSWNFCITNRRTDRVLIDKHVARSSEVTKEQFESWFYNIFLPSIKEILYEASTR